MELEVFKANFGYVGNEFVGEQVGFILNNRLYLERPEPGAELLDRFKDTRCSLISYNKFKLSKMPKDMRWFCWLIFHNFNTLVSTIRNEADVQKKLETFLDFEGD